VTLRGVGAYRPLHPLHRRVAHAADNELDRRGHADLELRPVDELLEPRDARGRAEALKAWVHDRKRREGEIFLRQLDLLGALFGLARKDVNLIGLLNIIRMLSLIGQLKHLRLNDFFNNVDVSGVDALCCALRSDVVRFALGAAH
jgi:hypothetical protein